VTGTAVANKLWLVGGFFLGHPVIVIDYR
jgi:hypothetical protein